MQINNKSISRIFLTILLITLSTLSFAQKIGLGVDFFGYADNREYGAQYTIPKTFFGATISPNLYFQLEENHRIYGGIHFNQEFGKHVENKSRLNPIAYYNYKTEKFDFALGFIPRFERLKDIPRMVLADTFMYDRPNIEGMYFNYQNGNVQQSVFIDWMSKQSPTKREQFVAGISGKYGFGNFFVRNDGLLYHNALTSNDSIDEHIQDNAVIMLRVGIDLSTKTFLDSLSIDAGGAIGFDRVRSVYDMKKSTGFISNVHLGYKRFFISNSLYLGQAMNLPNGDSFYHRDSYDRLDLGWVPFKTDKIEGKFTASFHFSPGQVDNQQMFTLRYNFGRTIFN
ncbi:hypothetical protein [Sphingobacterium endophyticum]|uniref:hypothetical protein n=1 Tax=Sphingobacterium endophyticum TaxID=2546448 RepID=UPI0012E19ED9|nr:hypothetical protein [Sphingobacterium endophyticum]